VTACRTGRWHPKKLLCGHPRPRGTHAVKAISDTLSMARSNLAVQAAAKRARQRRGRRPQPEAELVTEIKALMGLPPLAARVQEADLWESDRGRGRRGASTAWRHSGHGGARVKAEAAAWRVTPALTRAPPGTMPNNRFIRGQLHIFPLWSEFPTVERSQGFIQAWS